MIWTDMKNRKHGLKPPCGEYSIARAQELVVIPEGAVWGGRDDQPVQMRKGVPLKKEKGVDDGEAGLEDGHRRDLGWLLLITWSVLIVNTNED